jgi:hypothetical protein
MVPASVRAKTVHALDRSASDRRASCLLTLLTVACMRWFVISLLLTGERKEITVIVYQVSKMSLCCHWASVTTITHQHNTSSEHLQFKKCAILNVFTGLVITSLKGKVVSARHDGIWDSGGVAPPFFTLALDGGELSASRLCRYTLRQRAPGTHWIGSWVCPRAGLDAGEETTILTLPGIEPWPSSP